MSGLPPSMYICWYRAARRLHCPMVSATPSGTQFAPVVMLQAMMRASIIDLLPATIRAVQAKPLLAVQAWRVDMTRAIGDRVEV